MTALKALSGRRILVVRNDRIGDLVLALPLIQVLKSAGAYVGVLASSYAAPLLANDKRVDALVVDGPGALERIRQQGFDTALVLWPTPRNAWLLWRSGIGLRIGANGRLQSLLFNRRLSLRRSRGDRHETELNLDFARALGLQGATPAPRLSLGLAGLSQARAWVRKQAPKGSGPLVVLHPGSKGSALAWGPTRYAALGQALQKSGDARVIITGGPGDEGALETCAQALPKAAVMHGELELQAFAALLGQANLVCAGSTGPLHLAAAQGVPVLGFYPPVQAMSALRWGPRGSQRAVLSPAGLGQRIPQAMAAGTMDRISVDEAFAAAQFLLRTH